MKKKISAFLGPTNTGKTYAAINKIFNFDSGVIGFPLRLLARENYEFAKKRCSEDRIALITGEEKIIPKNAKYFFCTVESIPENLNFEFVAIDEIQMATNYERGYIFTEKIINKGGSKETLFLGSMSMEKILREIYPEIKIYKKPRYSKLSYIGYKNITRLPKRSAVIAFSQMDVYEIANKIKQSHGGVSIVLGALSPEVRNAQVKLFEDGKVDYIVATDAIGMGLNLDIKNIFFSSIKKFDGLNERHLTYDEIAQISGRAGRYLNNGFFGTTCDLKNLNNEVVNFVENYEYTEIKNIYWRNSKLDFKSQKSLLSSLSQRPKKKYLKLKKNGSDHRYLKIFLDDKEIIKKLKNNSNLRKLWEVCAVPDYSKNLDEYHTRFLKKLFIFLVEEEKKIPYSWIRNNLLEIKKFTKKISELNYKVSQIRTWSFISFKKDWITNNSTIQKEVKRLELNLSTRLHEELMSEFIGEFKNFEFQNFNSLIEEKQIIRIEGDTIYFGKEIIGLCDGLNFKINSNFKKSKNIFNNKILEKNLNIISFKIKNDFVNSDFKSFQFEVNGKVLWKQKLVGKFEKDKSLHNPKIIIYVDKYFLRYEQDIIKKIKDFFSYVSKKELPFIKDLMCFSNSSNATRGINFCLLENMGHCRRELINHFLRKLETFQINQYKNIGFRIGTHFFYYKSNKMSRLKQMLINIFFKNEIKDFINDEIFIINKKNFLKKKIDFYNKLGFYKIDMNNQIFLIYHQYYELLLNKVYFFKKKNELKFLPNNKFEEIFYINPKKIAH